MRLEEFLDRMILVKERDVYLYENEEFEKQINIYEIIEGV